MSYREFNAESLYLEKVGNVHHGGTNMSNPIDEFKVGCKFGHDTLGPALFGKK